VTDLEQCPDPEAVAVRAAAEIAKHLNGAVEQRGEAHLALSGGTTPARTYELLAGSPVAWSAVEVWFADERCVGPEDEQSNYRLAEESLLHPAGLAAERVHRMAGELGPEHGAAAYADELQARMPPGAAGLPVLDVVVLGIGPDGHVASLFPRSPTLDAPAELICLGVEDSPKPPPQRITLGLELLRAARFCLLLATGAGKADALAAMLGEPSHEVPASLLERERLSVIADAQALPSRPPADE
jgi:6-phosphogluconolactonase